ncbi:MAG: hypothetical protein AAGD25_37560 [Cyanobacteria bacterium P01_F01_bin.150]
MQSLSHYTMLVGLTVGAMLTWSSLATARPYPDELGICYRFQDDTLEQREPCVISAGYGAGAHYVVLHWSDDTSTAIHMINYCVDGQEFDDRGFCGYRVNDQDAEPYERDAFLGIATVEDSSMTCYRTLSNDESVCYR